MQVTATTDTDGICHITVENDGYRYELHGKPKVSIAVEHKLPEIVADPLSDNGMVVAAGQNISFRLDVAPKTVTSERIVPDPPLTEPDFDDEEAA